jgi:hypothetical protein
VTRRACLGAVELLGAGAHRKADWWRAFARMLHEQVPLPKHY